MANRERGEVEVIVDGRPYTWRLTVNAACALEARTGQKLGELLAAADALSMIALRDLVWVFVQEYHGAEFPTAESVGDFLDRLGVLAAVLKFREVLEVNQPRAGGAAATAGANPPEPQSGTGAAWPSRGGASV